MRTAHLLSTLRRTRGRARRPARRRAGSPDPEMRLRLRSRSSRSNPPPSRIVTSSIARPYGSRQVNAQRVLAELALVAELHRLGHEVHLRGPADTSTARGRRTRPSPAPGRASAHAPAGGERARAERSRAQSGRGWRVAARRRGAQSSVRSCEPLIAVLRFSVIWMVLLVRIWSAPEVSSSGVDAFTGTLGCPTPSGAGLASSHAGPPLVLVCAGRRGPAKLWATAPGSGSSGRRACRPARSHDARVSRQFAQHRPSREAGSCASLPNT